MPGRTEVISVIPKLGCFDKCSTRFNDNSEVAYFLGHPVCVIQLNEFFSEDYLLGSHLHRPIYIAQNHASAFDGADKYMLSLTKVNVLVSLHVRNLSISTTENWVKIVAISVRIPAGIPWNFRLSTFFNF